MPGFALHRRTQLALYIARGGLRSAITQQWLQESGVEYPRVKGGYKALRRWLMDHSDSTFHTASLLLVGDAPGPPKHEH